MNPPLEKCLKAHLERFAPLSQQGKQGVGWAALNLKTGTSTVFQSRRFLAASTIKLPILAMYAQRRQASVFQEPYAYRAEDHVEDSPFFEKYALAESHRAAKTPLAWDTLAEWMMILSDNAATNLLIRQLGLEAIQHWIETHGFSETVLARVMMDLEARAQGRENWTTPEDMLHFMTRLVRGELLPPEPTRWMLDILHRCEDPEKIPFLFTPPVQVANKPGELPGLRADVGYVHTPERALIISVFCDGIAPEHEEACDHWQAELAKILWETLL